MSTMLPPPAVVGIIGGGQLGMMTVREAQRMGFRSIVWDPDPDCPAARLADELLTAPFTDTQAAGRLAAGADVVTYEFENVDVETVRLIEQSRTVLPGSAILAVSQNRRLEKATLQEHGFPVPRHIPAATPEELRKALRAIGLPAVVKTATAGYDGKGQTVLRTENDARAFLSAVIPGSGYVVEEFLTLAAELSVLVARGADGNVRTFPPPENEHRENILHTSRLPARIPAPVQEGAVAMARRIITGLDMTGLLCVEMFLTADGRLLVNELAPRPHNSGHATLDACDCSQFEMFVRAVCGLPLPEPRLLSPCTMINVLGKHLAREPIPRLLNIPGAKMHLYGKRRAEPKRKMGHVTVLGATEAEVDDRVARVKHIIGE